jgi:hypothetical protein
MTENQPANLQMTVKDAAKLMNVSERLVYMSRRVVRSGRLDLVDAITRGDVTTDAALRIIDGPKPPPDRYAALVRAWNAACEEDRRRLLDAIAEATASASPHA